MRTIPSYELYGDLLAGTHPDPVHHETISERSSKHDWTIRLHRHRRLAQVFVFRTSGVLIRLDGTDYLSNSPAILVVPPATTHGFRFARDVVGDVVSLPVDALDPVTRARLDGFGHGTDGILLPEGFRYFEHVDTLVSQLRDVFQTVGPARDALLRGVAQLMVLYLADGLRQGGTVADLKAPSRMTRHELQADEFCNLIEKNFGGSLTVADYAAMIGISAPQLTRISRRILSATPNELVRQRRLVEAKRLLEYTRLPISAIAHRAGFQDAAFFSRTFKSATGSTPQLYRREKDR